MEPDPHPYMSSTLRGFTARDVKAHLGVGCGRLAVHGVTLQFDLDTPGAVSRSLAALARLKDAVDQLEQFATGQATADELDLARFAEPEPPAAVQCAPEPVPVTPVVRPPAEPYPSAPHVTGPVLLPGGADPAVLPGGDERGHPSAGEHDAAE